MITNVLNSVYLEYKKQFISNNTEKIEIKENEIKLIMHNNKYSFALLKNCLIALNNLAYHEFGQEADFIE